MKRFVLASALLVTAAGSAWADFDDALAAYRAGDFTRALDEWAILAKYDPAAQTNIGEMYLRGEGVEKDRDVAIHWFRRAADRDFPEAQYRLGRLYMGEDNEEAARWLKAAAEHGHVQALNSLASLYEAGQGVPMDLREAFLLRRKAAESGNAVAAAMLGSMYAEGKGVARNDSEAVAWYRKAAEQGYFFAQSRLGAMYRDGRGVPQDLVEAHMWFTLSAQSAPGELSKLYAKRRSAVEQRMSPSEVIDALQLAREWRPTAAAHGPAN
ncbi:MAG TPA: tetratricopeptide repeat protein [Alphaproteobacteria bacterium]